MNIRELKEKSRESLRGNLKEFIKLFLVYVGIAFIVSIILIFLEKIIGSVGLLANLGSILIIGFYAGYYSFFLKFSRNEEVTYKELFTFGRPFWITIAATIVSSIFVLLGFILFIIPGIIISFHYVMVYYVIVDNPGIGVMEALDKSSKIMEGHTLDYIILSLSFLGWYILDIFTLGILSIWLVPYMQVAYANFYNEIKD